MGLFTDANQDKIHTGLPGIRVLFAEEKDKSLEMDYV